MTSIYKLATSTYKLKKFLENRKNATEINFNCLLIDDEGAHIVAKFLSTNNCLKSLELENHLISIEGIINIAQSLRFNNTLTKLTLELSIDEAKEVLKILKVNNTITCLYIGVVWDFSKVSKTLNNPIDNFLDRNKNFVKETAKFLARNFLNKNKILLKKEDVYFLKYYQVADDKLLQKYLSELVNKSKQNKVNDVSKFLKQIDQYIAENYFLLIANIEQKTDSDKIKVVEEGHPFFIKEISYNITSFFGDKSLWEIDIRGNIRNVVKTVGDVEDYGCMDSIPCILL